jgi:putative ABC transport system permease protein
VFLYRLLLRLFPASFRAAYGAEMCAVFAARRRSENAAVLWANTIPDLVVNAARIQLDVLRQDLPWALRSLRRAPRFATTVVAVAALGIGAGTAAFTLLDHVLLRPLPFFDPDRVVMLYQTDLARGYARFELSPANFADWRAANTTFESIGAYGTAIINLTGEGDPMRLNMAAFTSSVFQTLGVEPFAGRLLVSDDDRVDAPDVAVLSFRLASALFGDATSALGRTLNLNDRVRTVVGVMPPGFSFPSREVALWLPYRFTPADLSSRRDFRLAGIARLRPGVSIEQARAEAESIAARLQREYPDDNGGLGATVIEVRAALTSRQSRTLVLGVFGAALCVILTAFGNLATLLFVRVMTRRQEIAVRVALGAGRERLVRQLLTESVVLAVIGGTIGIVLAVTGTPLLARLVPNALPVADLPGADLRVLAFATMLTLMTSIAFGVGPAVRSYGQSDVNALRSRSGSDSRTSRVRATFVVAQICGTVTLLVCTGLLLEAMRRVESVDPGFRSERVLTLRTELSFPKYNSIEARREFYSSVLDRARALPGVVGASYTSFLPLVFGGGIFSAGTAADPAEIAVSIRFITPDYFATLGIPLLDGRDVTNRDDSSAPLVTMISQSLANRLWPGQDAIGRQVDVEVVGRGWTVVGVVGDVSVRGLERSSEPQMYFPFQQQQYLNFYAPKDLAIRTAGDPMTLIPVVREIIREANPQQVISDVRLLDDIVASQTGSRRAQLSVLGIFATVAFLLAAVGIHGLLSYAVSTRTKEVGVRLALGAQRQDVLKMFLGQALKLGIGGAAVAVPLAYVAGRAMEPILFGVGPGNLAIYIAAIALALAMAVAGSLGPAARAARVEPARTVRNE